MAKKIPVKIKKIKPYPIEVFITGPTGPTQGKIILVEPLGIIVELGTVFFKIGSLVEVRFRLPVLDFEIQTEAKVVKTSDQIVSPPGEPRAVVRLAECHFQNLFSDQRNAINEFRHMIRQK